MDSIFGTLFLFVGLMAFLLALPIIGLRSVRAPRTIRQLGRRFFCPRTGAQTDGVLTQDVINGRHLGVVSCTERELHPLEPCHEDCVRALDAGGQLWQVRDANPATGDPPRVA